MTDEPNFPIVVRAPCAPTRTRARLTKLQKAEINRQAHQNALEFERLERERLTRLALEALSKDRQ